MTRLERNLLARARHAATPSASDKSRVFDALSVRLGLPAAPPSGGAPELTSGAGATTGSAGVAGGGVLAVAAGAAALVWALASDVTDAPAPPEQPGATNAPLVPAGSSEPTFPPATAERAPKAAEGPVERTEKGPMAPHPAQVDPRAPRQKASRTLAAERDRFDEELTLLRRAQRAARSGNGRLALGLLSELDDAFPKSPLSQERELTRILALCAVEEVDRARAHAKRWFGTGAGSIYQSRLAQSCVGQTSKR